jgi:nitrate reductase NapE component
MDNEQAKLKDRRNLMMIWAIVIIAAIAGFGFIWFLLE